MLPRYVILYYEKGKKMTVKKYVVYLDDGKDCFKVPVQAENQELACQYVAGNGEVIAVRDVTNDIPILSDKVVSDLRRAGFGEIEVSLMIKALGITDICYLLLKKIQSVFIGRSGNKKYNDIRGQIE